MLSHRTFLDLPPKQRLKIAGWVFDLSVWCLPPALAVTWIWPKVGMIVLQFISFLAITFTAADWLTTSDVREEQDR